MHTEAHLSSVPNDCLWYDKLWGPSQRVVTLFRKGTPFIVVSLACTTLGIFLTLDSDFAMTSKNIKKTLTPFLWGKGTGVLYIKQELTSLDGEVQN